ncbi:MAG: POTRA domain-containing protein, partial [Comamonas sp.]
MPKHLPTNTPAITSAFLLASALLLSGCSLLSKDKTGDAIASGPPSFTLEVQAPKEVRELLEQHMELQRYRSLGDLRRNELSRLLGAADANIRSLLGTMGYFSPTIELQLIETPENADTPRKVLVQVEPGEPTMIANAQVDFTGVNADDPKGMNLRESIRRNWGLPEGAQFTQSAWGSAK